MSLLAGLGKAIGFGSAAFELGKSAASLFGIGGENIAKNLSRELGCTIPQSQASVARGYVAQGTNPCTMQPLTPQQRAARPEAPRSPIPIYDQPVTPPGGGGMSMQAGMLTTGGGAIIRRAGQALGGVLRTQTGRIASIVLPSGARFTRKNAAALIRKFGPEIAAAALGIGIMEAAEILLTQSKTRRRRGITAAQVRNARRTACMVSRLARDLNVKPAARRASTCR